MKLGLGRVSVKTEGARDARRDWPERESLLLSLSDDRGHVGLGEASPLPGYSPDTLDAAEAALSSLDAAALATALAVTPARAALCACATLVPASLPSARMALETAALDLLGKQHGLSAPTLLGAQPGAQRPLAELIGPAADAALIERAERATRAGFGHLKLKLGAQGQLEAELLAVTQLRRRFGASVALRLDANGALTAAQVARAWQALAPLGIELFEEPGRVPESLASELPLGLDESLQGLSEDEVDEAMRRLKPRCLVLKPMALGGLDHCWRLAERARDRGVDVLVSHCFDGPRAWRAAAALALALPRGLAHGLAPHAALAAWQAAPPPVEGATLQSWREPGLGDVGSAD